MMEHVFSFLLLTEECDVFMTLVIAIVYLLTVFMTLVNSFSQFLWL